VLGGISPGSSRFPYMDDRFLLNNLNNYLASAPNAVFVPLQHYPNGNL
jgi:hypothetical protein